MSETIIEVGRFTFDTATGTLTGPAEYFASRGGVDAAVDKAVASPTFKYGAAGASPSPQVAFLVALQTDYAAFAGEKDLARMQRRAAG
jgi:hypothetical protein